MDADGLVPAFSMSHAARGCGLQMPRRGPRDGCGNLAGYTRDRSTATGDHLRRPGSESSTARLASRFVSPRWAKPSRRTACAPRCDGSARSDVGMACAQSATSVKTLRLLPARTPLVRVLVPGVEHRTAGAGGPASDAVVGPGEQLSYRASRDSSVTCLRRRLVR